MQCPRDNFRKSLDLSEDKVGGSGPPKGARMAVVVFHVGVDALDQVLDVAKGAATNRPLGDEPEPALDLIEPRGVS